MKVLILSHMFPNFCEPLAGIYVMEQAKSLRAAGIETVVFSPTPWAPRSLRFLSSVRKHMDMPEHENVSGFVVEHPRYPTLPKTRGFAFSGLSIWLSCRKLLRKYLEHNKIDLIHANTIMPDGFGAMLLGREFNLPVVCTVHGSDVKIYPYENRLVRWATQFALRHVDHLIAVSENLKQCTLELSGPREVHVVKNGADPEVFRPQKQSACRALLGLPDGRKIVCFVGHLRPDKAVDVLLEAFAKLQTRDVLLCLAGDGPVRGELVSQAERLGISQSCIFAGAQPHDRIALWMGASDCLVLCSLSEGLPTVLPEAMLCRLPVIATPVGGVPEIVRDAETGLLVTPGQVSEISHAIDRILSDQQFACQLAQNAYDFVKDRLTWDANARKTIAVYESALGKTPAIVQESDFTSTAA
jgi:teichuronic acid biosynthesis glycosyltransferase TuaC